MIREIKLSTFTPIRREDREKSANRKILMWERLRGIRNKQRQQSQENNEQGFEEFEISLQKIVSSRWIPGFGIERNQESD